MTWTIGNVHNEVMVQKNCNVVKCETRNEIVKFPKTQEQRWTNLMKSEKTSKKLKKRHYKEKDKENRKIYKLEKTKK